MATVKIRPYSSEDFRRISRGKLITNSGNAANASAISPNIFGMQGNKANRDTKQKVSDTFHLPGVIPLALAVPNYFLCEKDLSLLKKIMRPYNFDETSTGNKVKVDSIINCTYIYDTQEERFIDTTTELKNYGFYTSRFLIGGECIKHFMKKFDVQKEIAIEITSYALDIAGTVVQRLGIKRMKNAFKKVEVHCGDGIGIPIIDDYSVVYNGEGAILPDGRNISEVQEVIDMCKTVLTERIYPRITESRLSFLLQMREDEYLKNFYNLIQDYIAVLPIGFRKGVDGEQSPITKAYNLLIRANENLKGSMRQTGTDLLKVINCYKELIKCVKYVISDSSVIPSGAAGYKSILESVTGKTGIVREHLQSVIADNTGRTVIICNTTMSIDSVGIPYRMLREMCDVFYVKYLDELDKQSGNKDGMSPKDKLKKLRDFKSDAEFTRTKEFIDKLCDVPNCKQDRTYKILRQICPIFMMPVGRQPTLWKYGIQAFKVVPVDGMAIQLAPLCVVAFNADFDGDQMHTSVAVSLEAQKDLVQKMANTKNIYLSRDGSCHIYPRHEIIYGLWLASKMQPLGETVVKSSRLTNEIKSQIFKMVEENEYPLDSKVEIGGNVWSLGQMAVKCCAGIKYADYILGDMSMRKANLLSSNNSKAAPNIGVKDGACTDKWCKELLTIIYDESTDGERLFIETINNYTVIGTRIATNYPPNISLMRIPDTSSYVRDFENAIRKSQRYYNLGLETYDGYARTYAEEYDKMFKRMKDDLLKNKDSGIYLGDYNGYKLIKDSGGRGSDSTMMQVFGLKGRMQRNSNETFNAIVKNSMAHGLTGLEHLICAYGGRQGQIDKSLETATPGYIYRTLLHTMCNLKITDYDCGTTDGLLIDWDFIEMIVGNGNLRDDLLYDKAKEIFYHMVEGRYIIEKKDGIVKKSDTVGDNGIFEIMVARLVDNGRGGHTIEKGPGVHLRSPITCDMPCCQKCYGLDLSKHKLPVIGHAIGLEGAQSISEPLAQLILKNFQKGGVAAEGGLTSAFDIISAYIEMRTVEKVTKDKPRFYDIISPYTGEVEYMDMGNGVRHIFIKDNGVRQNTDPYILYNTVPIKSYVTKGQGIMLETGNFIISEVIDVLGIDYAIKYLAVKLWQIFSDQDVNLKHFEALVSCMIYYNCIKYENGFKAGKSYTLSEYRYNYGIVCSPDTFVKTLYSVKSVPRLSNDVLRGMMFEQQVSAMANHVLKNDTDELKDVYVRNSFGLNIDLV